ncbi:survival motor neuron protein 1 [Corythoichthys intestinalis]|uniref:survival motor neuron protein 1 n=1 Tax=Corythoichthys intestinalis TaxID=161448 RepID=UPI0025A5164B|nr:survival motor neuron protein 1 [Corythoichthys intestinalis]XP_061811529.1 survival motor neuron protein 1-like [Nerophis lumbriciformis]
MANGCQDVLFTRGAGQSDDSDIWDDTALIKAYDKAVASFKSALKGEDEAQASIKIPPGKKRKNNKKKDSRKRTSTSTDKEWQVGDSCCAYWSEDRQLYSATISSVDKDKGTCIVVYTDYGNEEEQNLEDLLSEISEGNHETKTTTQEAESSTEESDRSTEPSQHKQHLNSKTQRGKFHKVPPPMWASGFPPPCPPPMPPFRKGGKKQPGNQGHFPPPWHPMMQFGPPMIPPPPPISPDMGDDEAMGSMLISWYMSGYHTGYYLGLKQGRNNAARWNKPHQK